ncbi:MAG TPA: SOS response-associated peptidase family protein, partial [Chitinophagaceae bacterium]|nr:SOS response-associated peptidase family protein [Chitinophagaceae bacterium]
KRCLVFTTGFFEHRDIGAKKKLPYFIKQKDQQVFCLAGLYNYSPIPNVETGEVIGTFSIVTRTANKLLSAIHNSGPNSGRMPLILPKEMAIEWLRPDLTDSEIENLIRYEFPHDQLENWPVNTIRTKKSDDESVIEKVTCPGFVF